MEQKKIEIRVGAFVLFGLVIIGVLVVVFGRVGNWLNPTYPITVQFDNASGVIKNSQVLYRGAKVGTVADRPRIQSGGRYVELAINVQSDIQIPTNASFQVGSYGLLGDRFVNILPPRGEESGEYLQPGAVVNGLPTTGINDLAARAEPVIQRLDLIASKLDNEVFTKEFSINLNEAIKNANSALSRFDALLADAQSGKGVLHTLLKDPQASADLKATLSEVRMLTYNLRVRGPLFYSDVASKDKEKSEEALRRERKK